MPNTRKFIPGKNKIEDDFEDFKVDRDKWMDTLSDLIFLLITFFVLLITMSSMDSKALKDAFGLFNEASGVISYPDPQDGEDTFIAKIVTLSDLKIRKEKEGEPTDVKVSQDNALRFVRGMRDGLMDQEMEMEIFSTLKPLAEELEGDVQVIRIEDGVEVVIAGRILFPYGNLEIDPKGKELIEEVATILQLWGGEIKIVAMWSWHEGPEVLTQIVSILTNRKIPGRMIKPELFEGFDRKIRFILRKEDTHGQ